MDNNSQAALPPGFATLPLSGEKGAGLCALVDLEDYDELSKYRWFLNNHGYVVRIKHYTKPSGLRTTYTIYLHREIMSPPDDMQIDHLNHNKLDNRKRNLRICTASENLSNKHHKGYGYNKRERRWVVYIKIDGKWQKRSYTSEEEAKKSAKLVKSGVVPDKKTGFRTKFLPKYISRYMTVKGPRYYYRYIVNGLTYRGYGFETISDAKRNLIKSRKENINE